MQNIAEFRIHDHASHDVRGSEVRATLSTNRFSGFTTVDIEVTVNNEVIGTVKVFTGPEAHAQATVREIRKEVE